MEGVFPKFLFEVSSRILEMNSEWFEKLRLATSGSVVAEANSVGV